MNESPMQPSNFLARIGRRLDYLERLIRQVASAPIRNASIDGPVIISHRGAVTAPSATGGTVSVSPDGVTTVSEDGVAVRLNDGQAETQPAPGEPWVPLTADADGKAQQALDAAAGAVEAVAGKSTIVRSADDAPTGSQPDYESGDEWRKVDDGFVIAVWQHNGTEFVAQVLKGTMLSADAIDGKTVTGATVQTSAEAGRGVKLFLAGIIGYDAEGNVKTVIDAETGKITAVDGDFTGTITGSAIAGGAISIAEGVSLTIDEAFEASTGTTPPTGWTRQVVNTYGSGGITFLTSGGNPGRRAQLAMVAVPAGQASRQLLYPTTLECVDSYVAFDYRWDGSDLTEFIDFSGITLRLRSKSADAGSDFPDDPYLQMVDGEPTFNSGGDSFPPVLGYGTSAKLAKNVWHRIEVTLRGQAVEVKITPQGGTAYPIWRATLTRVATTGRIAFAVTSSSFLSTNPGGAPQTGWIDNVHIEALKTGFIVAPDGATTVERLAINQVGMAPDPMGPTDIVNLRSMLAVLPSKGRINCTGNGTAFTPAVSLPTGAANTEVLLQAYGGVYYALATGAPVTGTVNVIVRRNDNANIPTGTVIPVGWIAT